MEVLRNIGETVRHGWQDITEGWRHLVNRASSGITRFFPRDAGAPGGEQQDGSEPGTGLSFPRWGLLAGEVIDHGNSVIVQIELPGVQREDCDVFIEDGQLRVEGEKHWAREYAGASYRLMERAYGGFRRSVALPAEADPDSAQAVLRDGVLKIELKKKPGFATRRHRVQVQ